MDINKLTAKITAEIAVGSFGLEAAKALLEKIIEKAEEMNVKIAAAVCTKEAKPIAVLCMDDSFLASYDIAVNKAYTSVSLKMPTKELAKLAAPGGPLYGIENTNNGKIVIFGGGVPLRFNETIAGGLGVSGGTLEEDTYLADYGAEIFNKIMKGNML